MALKNKIFIQRFCQSNITLIGYQSHKRKHIPSSPLSENKYERKSFRSLQIRKSRIALHLSRIQMLSMPSHMSPKTFPPEKSLAANIAMKILLPTMFHHMPP